MSAVPRRPASHGRAAPGPVVPMLRPDPPGLHLAAAAFAYPVLDGTVSYGAAVSSVMRAALREGMLRDGDPAGEGIRERLEETLNRSITVVARDASETVTRLVRARIAWPSRPTREVLHEVAYAANSLTGDVLPRACVDWIVLEEVRAAVGMPRTRQAP